MRTETKALNAMLEDMAISNLLSVVGKLLDETPIQQDRPDYCSTITDENLDALKKAWDGLPLTLRMRTASGHMESASQSDSRKKDSPLHRPSSSSGDVGGGETHPAPDSGVAKTDHQGRPGWARLGPGGIAPGLRMDHVC